MIPTRQLRRIIPTKKKSKKVGKKLVNDDDFCPICETLWTDAKRFPPKKGQRVLFKSNAIQTIHIGRFDGQIFWYHADDIKNPLKPYEKYVSVWMPLSKLLQAKSEMM